MSSDSTSAGGVTPAPPLPPDLATVKQAIGLIQQRKFSEATALATSINDPVAQKLVEWAYLRVLDSPAGFDRYNAFLQANPDWSSVPLRRRAEARLWQEGRDASMPERCVLRVTETNGIPSAFRAARLSDDQVIEEVAGGFILTATLTPSRALRNLLLEHAPTVELLSPAHLRAEIAQTLMAAATRYATPYGNSDVDSDVDAYTAP